MRRLFSMARLSCHSRLLGDAIALPVQAVVFDALLVDRLESTESDMKSDLTISTARARMLIKNRRCEMQSGCGGGHRPTLLRVDRLISFAVGRLVVAGNIRRERHVSNAIERFVEISVLVKPDASFAKRTSRDDFRVEFLGWPKQQLFTDVHFPARTNQALPLIRFFRDLLGQEHFDPALKEITVRPGSPD